MFPPKIETITSPPLRPLPCHLIIFSGSVIDLSHLPALLSHFPPGITVFVWGEVGDMTSDNVKGLILAISSSVFIGSSFIIKKKGLQKAGSNGVRAGMISIYFSIWFIISVSFLLRSFGGFLLCFFYLFIFFFFFCCCLMGLGF